MDNKINEKFDKSNFDSKLGISLFPHQISSVKRMETLEQIRKISVNINHCNTKMGILGDIPGYGKSYSIVSLIARDAMEWKEGGVYENQIYRLSGPNMIYSFYYQENFTKIRENLIVVSTSILSQWEEYFKSSNLKVFVVTTRKTIEKFVPNNWDVVLISSNMYNLFVTSVADQGNYCWKRFIYDEPGVTHIPSMKPVHAGFYWFVTADSDDLYLTAGRKGYSSHFLHSIFRHLNYDTIKILTIENSEEYIRESFKMPDTVFKYHRCLNPYLLRVIKNHITNDINIMIQAGNIKGALEALGGGEQGNIIDVLSRRKKSELEVAEFKESFYKERQPIHTSEYERWKNKVENLKKEIGELEDKYKNITAEDCSICYNNLEDPVLLPKCQHLFCGACILEWYKTKNTCPLCRSQEDLNSLIYIKDGKDEKKIDEAETKLMSKPKTIINVIKNQDNNSKFIIFSDYDETFNQLKTLFLENEIKWIELTGTSITKNKKLKSFKEGDISVIFLNSKINCAGINLEECTDIILYHDMDYNVQTQIIGRANRIGRKTNLTVHKFQYC
jgi:SNF2 family DNA or RNA helicase